MSHTQKTNSPSIFEYYTQKSKKELKESPKLILPSGTIDFSNPPEVIAKQFAARDIKYVPSTLRATAETSLFVAPVAKINEDGAFAAKPIAKDIIICEYTGTPIDAKYTDNAYVYDSKSCSDKSIQNMARVILDAKKEGSAGRFVNHSFTPNCAFTVIRNTETNNYVVVLVALRNIYPGEQLLADYGEQYFPKDEKHK